MTEKKIYISLGWKCQSAVRRTTKYNLKRPTYETCVFDLMISNLSGIIKCFETDFQYFCNPEHLKYDGKSYIKNTYYKFMFNHETPGHADLHLKEGWPGNDKFHFTKNNFKMFIERYNRRIQSFKNYIRDNDHIVFILQRVNIDNKEQLLMKLKEILKKKYPKKKFSFDLFIEPKPEFYKVHLQKSGLDKKEIELNLK